MKKESLVLTEEQMDFLKEIINVGAGNGATALSQLLKTKVEMAMPSVYILPPGKALTVLGDPSSPVTCVRMRIVGQVIGEVFFIVPDSQKAELIKLARKALPGQETKRRGFDQSVLEEIGNIMVGVFFTAIHDFTKLNLHHTVPVVSSDMLQASMDETVARRGKESPMVVLIVDKFIISEKSITSYILIIPTVDSLYTLVGALKTTMRMLDK